MEKFNIRVYGIAFNGKGEILLTDEFRLGMRMTKFPGGGLEFGESVPDCLIRECREELKQEIEIEKHFYTTDFFQLTQHLEEPQQLICIYYLMSLKDLDDLKITDKIMDFEGREGAQSFRWVKLSTLGQEDLTFPIDKKVVGLLRQIQGLD